MKSDDRQMSGRTARRRRMIDLYSKCCIAAFHGSQDPVASRLHWQVHMADQLVEPGVCIDQPLREFLRVRGRVSNALDPRNLGDIVEQEREIGNVLSVARHGSTVGVDILPQQRDLANALFRKARDLDEHVLERSRNLFTSGVRHDAEAAVFAASFHDRHECTGTFDSGRWKMVELFDLGKRDVDLRAARMTPLFDQFRQAVQRLRTEHDVHVRGAADDRLSFLAGDTAANADDQFRSFKLELA